MLQVKGQRMDVNSKIRTRARAKEQAEQWQMVPLPAKLIALLADSVSESAGALPKCLNMPSASITLMHCTIQQLLQVPMC